jgi:hypothetical protein
VATAPRCPFSPNIKVLSDKYHEVTLEDAPIFASRHLQALGCEEWVNRPIFEVTPQNVLLILPEQGK